MKKAIMLSIRPEWVQKILSGEKTIEIRKTLPKTPLPRDVYIYCTKPKLFFINNMSHSVDELYKLPDGTIKYGNSEELMLYENYNSENFLNGKVVAKFMLNTAEKCHPFEFKTITQGGNETKEEFFVEYFRHDRKKEERILNNSCLSNDEFCKYGYNEKQDKYQDLYAWYIDDLQIFDKPMELGDFCMSSCSKCEKVKSCPCDDVWAALCREKNRVTRAPQSWQYAYID